MFHVIGIIAVVLAAVWASSYVGAQVGPENIPVVKMGAATPAKGPPAPPPPPDAPPAPPTAPPAPAVAAAEKNDSDGGPCQKPAVFVEKIGCVTRYDDVATLEGWSPTIPSGKIGDPNCKGRKPGYQYQATPVPDPAGGKPILIIRTCGTRPATPSE